jgi:hypothetical protein
VRATLRRLLSASDMVRPTYPVRMGEKKNDRAASSDISLVRTKRRVLEA